MARIPLDQVQEGSRVTVRTVAASPVRGRLCALGITPGAGLEVCSQRDQCLIRVQNAGISLGKDLACCIECEVIDFLTPEEKMQSGN